MNALDESSRRERSGWHKLHDTGVDFLAPNAFVLSFLRPFALTIAHSKVNNGGERLSFHRSVLASRRLLQVNVNQLFLRLADTFSSCPFVDSCSSRNCGRHPLPGPFVSSGGDQPSATPLSFHLQGEAEISDRRYPGLQLANS